MPGNPSFDRGNNKDCTVFSTMTGNSMHLLVAFCLMIKEFLLTCTSEVPSITAEEAEHQVPEQEAGGACLQEQACNGKLEVGKSINSRNHTQC